MKKVFIFSMIIIILLFVFTTVNATSSRFAQLSSAIAGITGTKFSLVVNEESDVDGNGIDEFNYLRNVIIQEDATNEFTIKANLYGETINEVLANGQKAKWIGFIIPVPSGYETETDLVELTFGGTTYTIGAGEMDITELLNPDEIENNYITLWVNSSTGNVVTKELELKWNNGTELVEKFTLITSYLPTPVQEVKELIEGLPVLGTATNNDKADIKSVGTKYDALTDSEKNSISADLKTKLTALRDGVKVDDIISGLKDLTDSSITLEYKYDVMNAYSSYNALNNDQRKIVSDANKTKIQGLKDLIDSLANIDVTIQSGDSKKVDLDDLESASFTFLNEEGKAGYIWTFTEIDTSRLDDTIFDLTITNDPKNDDVEKRINELAKDDDLIFLHFNHSGDFPGKVTIKYFVGDKYDLGEEITLYYYNETTKKAEKVGTYKVDNQGYIEFSITHCSDYFLTKYNNPDTGVEGIPTILLIAVALVGLTGIVYSVRKIYVK